MTKNLRDTVMLQMQQLIAKVKVKFICLAHFMYKTIQSALHKIKALQRGVEEALKIHKRI